MTHQLIEALLVYALVALCAAYCLWIFLPAGLKRRAAAWLMTRFTGLRDSRALQALARQQGGCSSGCSGCSKGGIKPIRRVGEHPIKLVKRR